MVDGGRLIEGAFPVREVSLDAVHEKNVRHGHVSTLHVWPARRPLAACRAALIGALLGDPGDANGARQSVLERLAGTVVETVERRRVNGRLTEHVREETAGGILHWGRENGADLQWFREAIRAAFGGRAPQVLDPFAGGGAIPLEAMRLGCEVTAIDLNPVAWLLLKCTLEYPQRLSGRTRPLPAFALRDAAFMEAFLKARGFKGATLRTLLQRLGHAAAGGVQLDLIGPDDPLLEADLAWQVRAWGRWMLAQARRALAARYPMYAEFMPLLPGGGYAEQPLRLLETDAAGAPQLDPLNAEYDRAYLADPRNARWVAKPTVAYLHARTVTCRRCRAALPLLKTRWLARTERKRVLLTMEPAAPAQPGMAAGAGAAGVESAVATGRGRPAPAAAPGIDGCPGMAPTASGPALPSPAAAAQPGVVFGVQADVPQHGGAAARRREHDRRIGAGTMSRSGAACPCCGTIMTMRDIRLEGRAGRLGSVMTAVVVDGPAGKEYRAPTDHERAAANVTEEELRAVYADIPFGAPEEPTPKAGNGASRAFSVDGYGLDTWRKLFTDRQLLALGTLVTALRSLRQELADWPAPWREAVTANLAVVIDRLADYSSTLCSWHNGRETIGHTFARFALPIVWDFAEVNPMSDTSGNVLGAVEWVARVLAHALEAAGGAPRPSVVNGSATAAAGRYDLIVTDPPYYDAIPYSDLMDFFYVWLRRSLTGTSAEIDAAFGGALGPKWDHAAGDGELIDDASRFDGDRARSKRNYEDGMAAAFRSCRAALRPEGRLVVVFANKQPDAWETLAAALIRAGFVVDASWPIRTEMNTRTRAMASAALSSSVWIVCRPRGAARPGWDAGVMDEMRRNVAAKLRGFWDAGIRGPDFVWAATGPALEAFSRYPVVKLANAPNRVLTVAAFLREVRRLVVDFVVGRVLTGEDGAEAAAGLDDVTTYYLLHRHDFGMDAAPVGGCILYALSCNLSDSALVRRHDLLAFAGRAGGDDPGEEEEAAAADGEQAGGGAKVRLKPWERRTGRTLGLETDGAGPPPLIDQAHRLLHLWQTGEQTRVDDYLRDRGLLRNALFRRLLQALIELAAAGSEERSLLEALSNHVATRADVGYRQAELLTG